MLIERPPLHCARIARPDDFAGWRDEVRALLAANVSPEHVIWQVGPDDIVDMFAPAAPPLGPTRPASPLLLPRPLLADLRLALLHRSADRFALGYRFLWRLRRQPALAYDLADADRLILHRLAKAVGRDMHKMHAFVRFRKTGERDGREQFAAWFEPEHHITRAVAGFFRNRFAGMDWLIVTPEASIAWNGATLHEGPGGTRTDVPGGDAIEAEWRAYYAAIFNPARLKPDAMKREMPMRYWRNLPEAALISSLTNEAGARTRTMIEKKDREPDLFGDAPQAGKAEPSAFPDLASLYAALQDEDAPPSAGFSDRLVTGEGSPNATLMLVGEQPGDQEDMQGRPFVGPAGQMLDACLQEAGLERRALFLTNAVKRFKFAQRGKRRLHQTPTAGDIAHYRWWLAEEVHLVNPRLVVALGATALHALSGRRQALAPVRGAALPWKERTLLPTIHPSFLLRLPDEQGRRIERERFVRELHKAATLAA